MKKDKVEIAVNKVIDEMCENKKINWHEYRENLTTEECKEFERYAKLLLITKQAFLVKYGGKNEN